MQQMTCPHSPPVATSAEEPDRTRPAFAQEPGKTGTGLRRANFSQRETGKNLVDTVAKNSNRGGGTVGGGPGRPRRTAVLPEGHQGSRPPVPFGDERQPHRVCPEGRPNPGRPGAALDQGNSIY